jgi:hypothetical protein
MNNAIRLIYIIREFSHSVFTLSNKTGAVGFDFRIICFAVIAFVLIQPVRIQSKTIDIDPLRIIHHSDVSLEYDDNVNLSSGIDEPIEDDYIFHYIPYFIFLFPHDDHDISLDINGDYRKRIKSGLSDFNLSASGVMDFNFSKGLGVKLEDTYTLTRFDHELNAEPGTSRSRTNHAGIELSYKFVERLRAVVGYAYDWEKSDVAYREFTELFAGLNVPVTWSIEGYLTGKRKEQNADEAISSWNYHVDQYVLGLKWTGPYRFSAFAETGNENIKFDSPELENIQNSIYKAGIGIKISEATQAQFSYGNDVYGNEIYAGEFTSSRDGGEMTMLSVKKNNVYAVFLYQRQEKPGVPRGDGKTWQKIYG